jgi:hypothetical protein
MPDNCKLVYKTPEGEEKEFKDEDALRKYLLSDDAKAENILSQIKSTQDAVKISKGEGKEGGEQGGEQEHSRTGSPRDEKATDETNNRDFGERGEEGEKEKEVNPWTAIRKQRLSEIEAVRKMYKKETGKKWTQIQQGGLEDVAKEFPEKDLYGAVKAKVEQLADKYDKGVSYNPTAKDLAVIQEFKRQTETRLSDLSDPLTTEDADRRQAAIIEAASYENDLVNAAKASFTREAGTAFGFRQSESSNTADYGLQIRRMQLMKAQGGDKLTPEQEAQAKEQWGKDKTFGKEEADLREKSMREDFDKKLEALRKELMGSYKTVSRGKSSPKEKTLSQKGKDVADKIRKLKLDPGTTRMDFTLGGYNLAVEGVAKLVEAGSTVAEAIQRLIDEGQIGFKTDKDRTAFEDTLADSIDRADRRDKAAEGIEKMAKSSGATEITPEMVAKKHISNFVNSYLGQGDTDKILDEALGELQKTLPDATKGQLIDAYLHENEFNQPTRSELQKSLDEARRNLVKTAKKEREQSLTADQSQKELLAKEKENSEKAIKEFERKLKEGEFEDAKTKTLNKYDADLIKLNKKRADSEHAFRVEQNKIRERNKHAAIKLAEAARGLMVTAMIGNPLVFAKVLASGVLRPLSEATSKLTFGKVFEKVFPGISEAARRGGESESLRSVQKGYQAYFRQKTAKGLEAMGQKVQDRYAKAQDALNAYTGTDEKERKRLQSDRDNAYLAAASHVIYQYIGGSSIKDSWNALLRRSNQIEEQFGAVDREGLKGKGKEAFRGWNLLDNIAYVTNFIGRSHAALKTPAGRFYFASAFMARLEQGLKDGVDLGNPDRLMEYAHESFMDWNMGKLQQGNYVSDAWNYMVRQIESPKPLLKHAPGYEKYGKVAGIVLRSDVAISRIPNNIAVEAFDYTVGAFRGLTNALREYNKARGQAKNDYGHLTGSDEFKDRVADLMANMDPKRAASIVRSFRRGGLGLGLYALTAYTIGASFGAFKHMGQPQKKDPDELGDDELNPGQIMFGDDKLGQGMSDMISETPALFPMLMGTGMSYVYKNSIEKDKTSQQAAEKSFMTHLLIMQERSPQVNLFNPIGIGKTFAKAFSDRYDQAAGLFYADDDNK